MRYISEVKVVEGSFLSKKIVSKQPQQPRVQMLSTARKHKENMVFIIGQAIGPLWGICAPISIIVEL